MSTNLAVGLASNSPRGVVIVDLDLQFGDVAYALGLRPRHTMFDAVSHDNASLDITTLKVFLTHHQSDLYALCAPDDPARGELIDSDLVERVITLLATDFDHVVVDTPAGLTEQTLTTLDVRVDRSALNRARAHKCDLHSEIVKILGLSPQPTLHLGSALDLEDPDGVCITNLAIDIRVVEWDA